MSEFEFMGGDNLSLLGCHDSCPKNLLLSTQFAFLRRKMARVEWK
ncbi:MAG TPA: hypothetical protein VHV54_15795 [Candidatus Binatia bacterium]|nr:hypothetical protein [Candidatus Binatia bacterium]